MIERGEMAVQQLGGDGGECFDRSRTLRRTEAQLVALSHTRGMAAIASKGRRIILLDLEETAVS